MSIHREVQSVMLILMRFFVLNAHILRLSQARQELTIQNIQILLSTRGFDSLDTVAECLGISKVDIGDSYLLKESIQFLLLLQRNVVVVRASLYTPIQNLSQDRKMKLNPGNLAQSNWIATVPNALGSSAGSNISVSAFYELVANSIN